MTGIKRTREEVADIIDRFLDGTCGPWDWDDLCSLTIEDPDLDHVRTRCIDVALSYPPTEKGHYCGPAGRDYLRQLARKLRQR